MEREEEKKEGREKERGMEEGMKTLSVGMTYGDTK